MLSGCYYPRMTRMDSHDRDSVTYEYQGRDFRLTEVYGNVDHEFFA